MTLTSSRTLPSLLSDPTPRRPRRGSPNLRRIRRLWVLEPLEDRPLLSASIAEAPSLVVTTTQDVVNPDDGQTSLREAVSYANSLTGPHTITFASSLAGQTVALTTAVSTYPLGPSALVITGSVAIDGSAAPGLTIARDSSSPYFRIFYVDPHAILSLQGLTISGGHDDTRPGANAGGGGGVVNLGALTVTSSILSDNGARGYGGAILNYSTAAVINSTFSGNAAGYDGGAITNIGTMTVVNSTLSGNSDRNIAGGIENFGVLTLNNTIVVDGDISNDASGILIGSHNLLGTAVTAGGGTITLTGTIIGDPMLGPLADNGGPTQTMALLAGSPAINAGDNALAVDATGHPLTTDQRGAGYPRIFGNNVDIGAFELQAISPGVPASITATSGGGQSTQVNTTFASPLVVTVTDALGNIVPGVSVVFAAPTGGAGGTFSNGATTITGTTGADGRVSEAFTANSLAGSYTVTVSANAVSTPASFSLTNTEDPSLVVTTTQDVVDPNDGQTSLREAVAYANSRSAFQTITFASSLAGGTVALTTVGSTMNGPSALAITGSVAIDGSAAPGLTIARTGATAFRIFQVVSGGSLSLQDVTISGGKDYSAAGGGGIDNEGMLMVTDSTIAGNWSSVLGGAIANVGTLTVIDSTLAGNSANSLGGGIYNRGTLTITNSTLSGNSASDGDGGGICNRGTLTITNSTLAGNSARGNGGGIHNGDTGYVGTLTIINSTLSGNSAFYGGGIGNRGTLTIINSTLSGNSASVSGGGIYNGSGNLGNGTATLNNTIVANSAGGKDIYNSYGSTVEGRHNLLGRSVSGTGTNSLTRTIIGDPMLEPLADNGGPTQTMALLPYSPAINAGDNRMAIDASRNPLTTDQRGTGYPRIVGGTVDIGAFEDQSVVVPATTTTGLVSSNASSTYGQSVTFTATITAGGSPVHSGTVTFLDGSTVVASGVSLDAAGKATYTLSNLVVTASPHSITAQYQGASGFSPSSGSTGQTITRAPLTLVADDVSMGHYDPLPNLTYHFTGFVLGQNANSAGVSASVSLSTSATSNSPIGYYPIHPTVSSFSAANYSLAGTQDGTLTVRPKVMDLRVHFGSQAMSLTGLNRDLPFTDITALDVIFSDDVSVSQSMLRLLGVNVPAYQTSGFHYDPATRDATWTLPTAIGVDRLMLDLSGATAPPQFGTGPAIAMTPFATSFRVLPGDVDGDGTVTIADAVKVRNQQAVNGQPYVVWDDVDGSGTIDAADLLEVRKRSGWHLP